MWLRYLGFQLIAVSFLAAPAGAATVVSVGDEATLRVRDVVRLLIILLVCIVETEISQTSNEAIARVALQRLAQVGSGVAFQIQITDRCGRSVAQVLRGIKKMPMVHQRAAFSFPQEFWPMSGPHLLAGREPG